MAVFICHICGEQKIILDFAVLGNPSSLIGMRKVAAVFIQDIVPFFRIKKILLKVSVTEIYY